MTTQSGKIENRAAQLLSLQGKTAMVTGAASGIGRGILLRLAEMGAFVAILDIDEDKVRGLMDSIAQVDRHLDRSSVRVIEAFSADSQQIRHSGQRNGHGV